MGFSNQNIGGSRAVLRTAPDVRDNDRTDANAGAGAATDELAALMDQLLGQTANGYQRQKLRRIFNAHVAASTDAIRAYIAEQQAVYASSAAAKAIETVRAEAIVDPLILPNAVLRAEDAARALCTRAGGPKRSRPECARRARR